MNASSRSVPVLIEQHSRALSIPSPPRRASAGFKLPLLIAVLAAVGVSLLLVPRGQEMALLRLEAGDAAGARDELEQRYAAGEHSPAIIATLARLRSRTGDLPGAVALLEPLATERPRDREVLDAIVDYRRRMGGDPAGLLRALIRLEAVAPTLPRQREIAWLHGMLGQVREQRVALERLVAADRAEAGDLLALARLEADAGAPAAGIAALQRLARNFPEAMDQHAAALAVSLHIQAGQPHSAAAAARDWIAGQDSAVAYRVAPVLASFLSAADQPALALMVLEPLAGPDAPPALLMALTQAEIDAGRESAALARLDALPGGANGALELRLLRLRLALALGDLDRAADTMATLRADDPSPEALERLAATALDHGRADILRRVLAWGGTDVLAAEPALAAEVSLLLGDGDAARRWAAAALGAPAPGDTRRALGFALALTRIGRQDDAMTVIAGLAAGQPVQPALLGEFARGVLRTGRAAEGAALLDTLRRRGPSQAADAVWALVAAAVPARAAEVAAWLDADTSAQSPTLLRDLAHVAVDAGAHGTAAAAARRLVALADTEENRRLLVRLLIDAGHPGEALVSLRVLQGRGVSDDAMYEAVLTAAWRQGEPVSDELRAIWAARLAAAANDQERGAALAMLGELGGQAEQLPALRRMAAEDPERWLWSYAALADRLRRPQEATALWAEVARRGGLRPDYRRQLAFGLIERGARADAEVVFRSLAVSAGPESVEVRQLLFVWGQRPSPAALAWLETRARGAGGADKAVWMRLLSERNAARRAVAVYGGEQGPVREAYLIALGMTGDRAALARVVREELPRATTPDQLRQLAVLAGQSGNAALEDQVLRVIVQGGGGDPAMRRRVGLAAFRDGDMPFAERVLAEHARATGGDAETLFLLGEIRQRQRDETGARRYHEAALARIGTGADARRMHATLLRRLGRNQEALPIYTALLDERPDDRHLRADLVALLMELRDYQRARTVLAER